MKRVLLAVTALGLIGSSQADVTVNFRNNVLTHANRLVTFASSGLPVVNELWGRSYVAQLYLVQSGDFIPIGNTADFWSEPQTHPLAGTWRGANRTIPGLSPDAVVQLAVRVWEKSYPSYEAASAEWSYRGQSQPFTYRNALSNPPAAADTHMVNFPGVVVVDVPEPETYALVILGLGGLLLWHRR